MTWDKPKFAQITRG